MKLKLPRMHTTDKVKTQKWILSEETTTQKNAERKIENINKDKNYIHIKIHDEPTEEMSLNDG